MCVVGLPVVLDISIERGYGVGAGRGWKGEEAVEGEVVVVAEALQW